MAVHIRDFIAHADVPGVSFQDTSMGGSRFSARIRGGDPFAGLDLGCHQDEVNDHLYGRLVSIFYPALHGVQGPAPGGGRDPDGGRGLPVFPGLFADAGMADVQGLGTK